MGDEWGVTRLLPLREVGRAVRQNLRAAGEGGSGDISDRSKVEDMAQPSLTGALLILTLVLTLQPGHLVGSDFLPVASAPGDFIIGGLFPIHEDVNTQNRSLSPQPLRCIRFEERGLTWALAMVNAIEVVNRSPLLTEANVSLGYHILDSCSDVSTALRATEDFLQRGAPLKPVTAVVGASFSETSIAVARLLTLNMIPQISYASTAVILSDKSRFPAFMRTVPNDEHQIAAMVTLLTAYNWTWVGVVTTDGDYGRSALENFGTLASENGICVAFRIVLPESVTSHDIQSAIRDTAKTIYNNPKVQVIVSFAKPTHMVYLYQELRNEMLRVGQGPKSMRRLWVASDSWASSSSARGNLSLEEIGQVIGFTFKKGNLTSFESYLDRLGSGELSFDRNDPFIQELFTQLNGSGYTDSELASKAAGILKQNTQADTIFSIELAVSAIAEAVASICRSRECKGPGALPPWEVLQALWMQEFTLDNHSYRFNSRGDINLGYDVKLWSSDGGNDIILNLVLEYHVKNNSFTNVNNIFMQLPVLQDIISKCSNSCVPGEFKKTAEGQHTCCYECVSCTENYYSNDTDMDLCLSCDPRTQWSPAGSSTCITKALLFFSWNDGFAVVLLTFSALGIVLVLLVSALFLYHRDTPVVKAAGGPLSLIMLFSLILSYISAILFVGRPTHLQCNARQVLYSISFTLCVSCILVKTLKILLAFQFNLGPQGVLRRLYHPYIIITLCVALQAVICICWLVFASPFMQITIQPTTLLEDCHEGSYLAFGVMLGYIAVLAFVCFICAFKGRKLPHQYNEARFITFSMLLYLISWMLFIPIYVTTTGLYVPAVEMVVILLSNYGILCCHFFPKCYIILLKKEQNTSSAFRKNLYEYSNKTTNSVTESSNSQCHFKPPFIPEITPSSFQPAVTANNKAPLTSNPQHQAGRRSSI
ncbi:G-protein coupled receptor family C group 6 member A [Oryzias latipes]|uniref:G-protein coupled receptor family C group 6 member A n=1 Tax=Oryzias latipes TaxID=8090 RepID=H2LB71_ORYLA|nr:G-protein coupled receptor family C group 6 member A [Oryzias latipes]